MMDSLYRQRKLVDLFIPCDSVQPFLPGKLTYNTELQIRGGTEDNSKTVFLISQ